MLQCGRAPEGAQGRSGCEPARRHSVTARTPALAHPKDAESFSVHTTQLRRSASLSRSRFWSLEQTAIAGHRSVGVVRPPFRTADPDRTTKNTSTLQNTIQIRFIHIIRGHSRCIIMEPWDPAKRGDGDELRPIYSATSGVWGSSPMRPPSPVDAVAVDGTRSP